MPVDALEVLAAAMMAAAKNGGLTNLRNWNVPTVAERFGSPVGTLMDGSPTSSFQAPVFATGWNSGANAVVVPFTSGWSFIDGSGHSADIVTGS